MEYSDPQERKSAPIEIFSEFLTSVMLKDYETALRLCSQILIYEPNNSTAREFYPLIVEKLEMTENEDINNSSDTDSTSTASDSESLGDNFEIKNFSHDSTQSDLSLRKNGDSTSV